MALKMPTSAMIPIAMIKTVRIVRNIWLFIESMAILIFSRTNENINWVYKLFPFKVRLTKGNKVTINFKKGIKSR